MNFANFLKKTVNSRQGQWTSATEITPQLQFRRKPGALAVVSGVAKVS